MADTIHIKLPDGSVKDVPRGTTALDVAKSISPRLADAALVAQISSNGDKAGSDGQQGFGSLAGEGARRSTLIDLTKPLENDTDLRLITEKDPEASRFIAIRRRICWRRRCWSFFLRPSLAMALPLRADFFTIFTGRLRLRPRISKK